MGMLKNKGVKYEALEKPFICINPLTLQADE
jgi:hypothetical protein